ncbi:hypothetical protein CORC01_02098 [Colletotrichum orchidophilum]|uniref:Uncharacterized protein n=1 Tax=Colletotrichum orchidophilum TaxID=1209926 RepID=A0A1G4BML3_9PEZI|nr:uncharacterized protein CORC01_02098 [Colletotrichum orchidophilum]OHF02702.1 hypothetical protein CORC01_02098 [Colletotrichum orchidophilum]
MPRPNFGSRYRLRAWSKSCYGFSPSYSTGFDRRDLQLHLGGKAEPRIDGRPNGSAQGNPRGPLCGSACQNPPRSIRCGCGVRHRYFACP